MLASTMPVLVFPMLASSMPMLVFPTLASSMPVLVFPVVMVVFSVGSYLLPYFSRLPYLLNFQ
jgi:hypothetical protein